MSGYTITKIEAPTSAVPSHGVQSMREAITIDNTKPQPADRYTQALAKVKAKTEPPKVEADAGTKTPAKPVEAQSSHPHKDESAPPPASEEPKTEGTVTLSPQMAALARKEQKFRQQEQSLKDREKALEARLSKIAQLEELEAKLAKKDYSGIESLVDYDEYTNYLINKGTEATPEQQAVKKLAAKVDTLEQSQKASLEKQFEAAVEQRRQAVLSLVDSSPEFVTIKELKAQEAVVQHILDTFEHDDVELTPDQAAKEVEEALLEQAKSFAALSKLKPKAEEPAPKVEEKPVVKTLTNNMQATGDIKRPQKSLQGLSDTERWAEARRRVQDREKAGKA